MPVYHPYSTDLRPDFVHGEIHAAPGSIFIVETRLFHRSNAANFLHQYTHMDAENMQVWMHLFLF